jgi:UDP-N-acetylglucosamine 2-epimerase (non-hydrolysing)
MKILVIFGTRPEAIKLAPLINRLRENNLFKISVCNTGQHRDLVNPIIDLFKIKVDYELNSMEINQGLTGLTCKIITSLELLFISNMPDYIIVHGDTTTSFASALAAFYAGIKIIHVEAGLRTFNKKSPFPEEINRTLTGSLADFHFAPTQTSKNNLIAEGKIDNVFVTGNTVIDSLYDALKLINEDTREIKYLNSIIDKTKKIILFTGHRRENFGDGFDNIFESISNLTLSRNDIQLVYPVHPNPNVKVVAQNYFKDNKNVLLIEPLDYSTFIWLLNLSYLVITDSGGIQEEAPSLGKPVLVIRDTTERPEAVIAGTVILVGSNKADLLKNANKLLDDNQFYSQMSSIINPYGDGLASDRIIKVLENLQEPS